MIDTAIPTDFVVNEATRYTPIDAQQSPTRVFQGFLDRAKSEGAGNDAQLREAAEKFVSTSMIMPLFSQLRSSPLADNPFHGGRGESVFQQQLDQVMADRISGATRFDLVDAVYKQLNKMIGGDATSAPRSAPTNNPASNTAAVGQAVNLHA